jgi:salicylate hydroxylase
VDCRILIVGGGIGGLGTALALAANGISSMVVERAPEFSEIGAGIQLGPNFMRVLNHLGLRQRVLRDAWLPGHLVVNNAMTGARVTQVPVSGRFRERFGAEYALIHRADLLDALVEAAQENPLIDLRTNAEVSDLAVHGSVDRGDLVAEATFADGTQVAAQGVIGADGLWSRVRECIIGDGPPQPVGHVAYRAVLERQDVPDDLWSGDMTIWLGPRTHLVTYPLRRGELLNLVAVFHSDRYVEGYDRIGEVDELFRHFGGECSQVLRLLERIETWKYWVLCDREPRRGWSVGPVTLVGDAAHPMLQYLGQGGAMSMEDGLEVARQLVRHSDIATAFAAYEENRVKRTARAQVTSRIYGHVFHASGLLAEMRDEMVGAWSDETHWDGMAWLYDHDPAEPVPLLRAPVGGGSPGQVVDLEPDLAPGGE